MRVRACLLQTLAFLALLAWVFHAVPSREWRALEALRFSRSDPRPAWHEVETRFRELSHWCLSQTDAKHLREQRRAARAYRYLRGVYAEETEFNHRLADWLRQHPATRHRRSRPRA